MTEAKSTLCLEKLKHLWRNFNPDNVAEEVRIRWQDTFDALEYLLKLDVGQLGLKDSRTAKDLDVPEQGMNRVKDNLITTAREIGGELAVECVEKTWNRLCNHQWRKDCFNPMSSAYVTYPYETQNCAPDRYGLASWFFSYNFPWHIAQWMQEVHNETLEENGWGYFQERDDQIGNRVTRHRFLLKYIWMLSKSNVLPILSLWSFWRLQPVFEEVQKDFLQSFGIADGVWQQDIADFAERWPSISSKILEAVLGKTEFTDDEAGVAERKKFSLMIFAASLTDSSALDLESMLETGNHAVILYGPPGTGKTYQALELVKRLLGIVDKYHAKSYPVSGGREFKPSASTAKGWMSIVQFHPNYTYQDFVGGIFPDTDKTGHIVYEKRPGIFQNICEIARTSDLDEQGKAQKKYFLIIDEINRADLSGVFGELLYGLEYRGPKHPIDIPLFEPFYVPQNVYIIGTMNNTDKSLIGFDLALRRRFGFLKIMPDMDVLREGLCLCLADVDNIDLTQGADEFAARAIALNKALSISVENGGLGLSEDKQIGHAYFLKIRDFCPPTKNVSWDASDEVDGNHSSGDFKKPLLLTRYAMEQLWTYHISPLLEEYLGAEFEDEVRQETVGKIKNTFLAEFPLPRIVAK